VSPVEIRFRSSPNLKLVPLGFSRIASAVVRQRAKLQLLVSCATERPVLLRREPLSVLFIHAIESLQNGLSRQSRIRSVT
jgi:hypothetical protein